MDIQELRERYDNLLLQLIRDSRYPSFNIMQRVEQGVQDQETALEYIGVLIEKCEGETYPSLPLLDRISRLTRQFQARMSS